MARRLPHCCCMRAVCSIGVDAMSGGKARSGKGAEPSARPPEGGPAPAWREGAQRQGCPVTAKRVVVRGRVQGVGYRYAMVDAARACGVTGWVRNRRDGSVEALVQGESWAIESIIAWCRKGPSAAH